MTIVNPREFFELAGIRFYMPERYMLPGRMKEPISQAQKDLLHKLGIGVKELQWKGHADRVISIALARKTKGLATPGQMRMLRKLGRSNTKDTTFADAKAIIGDSHHW